MASQMCYSAAMNAQIEMERLFQELSFKQEHPELLLHACCAPCASYPLSFLPQHFSVAVYYDNPNIMPRDEFEHRKGEFAKLRCFDFRFLSGEWDNAAYLDAVRGYESEPEGGSRCGLCFRFRLERSAQKARELGCSWLGTTLSVSPHKNAALLNTIGVELAQRYGLRWLTADFKKKDGYKRSVSLCRELGIYRQSTCGCAL